jgi:methylase of polypeptide subunit release factors
MVIHKNFGSDNPKNDKYIEYIFCDQNFKFMVRPEVSWPNIHPHLLLHDLGVLSESSNVLDLGCGSGFMGIVIAKCFGCNVTCSDYSKRAVANAIYNAKLNSVTKIDFYVSDLFDKFGSSSKFDLIVCNPPQSPVPGQVSIPGGNSAGPSGLDVINRIVSQVKPHLTESGQLKLSLHSFLPIDHVIHQLTQQGFNVEVSSSISAKLSPKIRHLSQYIEINLNYSFPVTDDGEQYGHVFIITAKLG